MEAKFYHRLQKSLSLVQVHGEMSSVHTFLFYFLQIRLISSLDLCQYLPSVFFHSVFMKKIVHISYYSYACCFSFYLILLCLIILILFVEEYLHVIDMHLISCYYIISLRSKHFPQRSVLKHNLYSSLDIRNQVSPHIRQQLNYSLHILIFYVVRQQMGRPKILK